MITKILICDHCNKKFTRTNYPSTFKKYKKKYCSKKCAMIGAARDFRPNKIYTTRPDGRVMVRVPHHPNANKNGQIPLAHIIMEAWIERFLREDEVVHHKDLDPSNDDLSNLKLMKFGKHVTLHNNLKERHQDGTFKKVSKM